MIVNLIKNRELFSITLPERVKGQYWINDIDVNGECRSIIGVEAHKNEWVLKSNKKACILDRDSKPVKNTVIDSNSFFNLRVEGENEKAMLFCEPISADRYTFKKLLVKNPCTLSIGRVESNNIVYSNKYVSSNHCELTYTGSSWYVVDKGSKNGTFVNDYRIDSQELTAGDYIYIMGLKIIVGSNFIAVNNPNSEVKLNADCFANFKMQTVSERDNIVERSQEYFYRSPRFMRQIKTADIKIDPPPTSQKQDDVPLALTLGPSMTMGIASLSTAVMSIMNVASGNGDIKSVIPSVFMSVSMLMGTVLWPILTKKNDKKRKLEGEKKRQEKYLKYLDNVRDRIKRECKEQSDILNETIIPVEECVERISMVKRSLWERTIGQEDFLKLRLGRGNLPLSAKITCPESKFTMDNDNLQDAMLSLGNEKKELENVPISISLVENTFSGVVGEHNDVVNLAKNLVIQMVALHSYDELKIMLITNEVDLDEWEFTRNIYHFWNDDKTERYIAASNDEVKALSVMIEKNIISRIREHSDDEYNPYYVIISTDKELSDKCESLSHLYEYKENCGFSIINIRPEFKDLPKDVSTVVEINGNNSKVFDKNDITGKNLAFIPECVDGGSIDNAAHIVSNLQLDIGSNMYSLPNMITFMEMFNVGKIEALNPLTRWKENNPVNSIKAPIGVDTMGETFYLDLHEKYHGPHGLVAGMTGSGKSEFIITYILSLAVNYHPDEVAFILIDYKGGGLAGAFEDDERGIKLPHLAGTITNLDGAAIQRSLVSIQSELRRRQAIFNDARKISNEGTMDIYKYQRLYRSGVVSEPVPHLFIISDEFAELKTQQPEFMEQLISAARIGRSLGVHLILATQKPAGVVDDQIWSNSKFRVCLKVQDKADSMDMIKRPEAAELVQTGRFYLQVGFNEFFALGQSAWCGAEYIPSDVVEKKVEDSVEVIDNLARVVKEIKPEKKIVDNVPKIKQIVGIVKYLSDLAKEENIYERPLWLDPIPARIFVDVIESKYGYVSQSTVLEPVVGEYDDPYNQKQDIVTIPLSKEGNCVAFGAAGNGKATFVTTLLYSLLKHHNAEELNVYIADFGSETLKAFEKAPQVGGVVTSSDDEKVVNLFKMLFTEFNTRKNLFSEYGGDYESYIKSTGNIIPNIVVIINNYAGFAEGYEQLEEYFSLLSRDGVKYGITFVVTATSPNEIRYRYLQNFKQVLTMQLNDPSDYPIVIGKTNGIIPMKYKGRGLINIIESGKIFEFQTAYCDDCDDQYEFVRNYCTQLAQSGTVHAKRIPVLPDYVKADDLDVESSGLVIPFGIEKQNIKTACVDITNKYIYPVVAMDTYILESFAGELVKVIDRFSDVKYEIVDCEKWCDAQLNNARLINDNYDAYVDELFEDVLNRNNGYKQSGLDDSFFDAFSHRIVVVYGMEKFYNRLDEQRKDKLNAILVKGQSLFKVHFVMLDSQNYYNSVNYSDWFKANVPANEGLYIGDGFGDQYIIKPNKHSNSYYDEIGPNFGYAVSKGKPVIVKVLTTEVEQ